MKTNRTVLSLLMAGLLAGLATSAAGKDIGTAFGGPVRNAQSRDFGPVQPQRARSDDRGGVVAQDDQQATSVAAPQPGYSQAKDEAQSRYLAARAGCEGMSGEAFASCMSSASAARSVSLAQAKAEWEPVGAAGEPVNAATAGAMTNDPAAFGGAQTETGTGGRGTGWGTPENPR